MSNKKSREMATDINQSAVKLPPLSGTEAQDSEGEEFKVFTPSLPPLDEKTPLVVPSSQSAGSGRKEETSSQRTYLVTTPTATAGTGATADQVKKDGKKAPEQKNAPRKTWRRRTSVQRARETVKRLKLIAASG